MPLAQAHLQRRYQSIILAFIVLVFGVIAGTVYAGFATTTIELTPLQTDLQANIVVTISPEATGPNGLVGTVAIEERSTTVTVEPTGPGLKEPAQARGTVVLHNDSGGSQSLVQSTRLQTENGVIVRLAESVTVPAGGTVSVEAVADPLGLAGEIQPGRLTIVALRPANQALIYGIVEQAFTGGEVEKSNTLSVDELTKASNEARSKILQEFGDSTPGTFQAIEPLSVATDPSPETPSSQYTVTVTVQTMTITYDHTALLNLLRDQLEVKVPDDQALASIAPPELQLEELLSLTEASVKVSTTAFAQLRSDSPIIQPTEFVNLDREEIVKKLLNTKLVDQVAVRFSPWWRSSAPAEAKRIQVVIVENDLTNTDNSVESP